MLVTIKRFSELAGISIEAARQRIRKGLLKVEPKDIQTGIRTSLIDTIKYPPEAKIRQGRPLKNAEK